MSDVADGVEIVPEALSCVDSDDPDDRGEPPHPATDMTEIASTTAAGHDR